MKVRKIKKRYWVATLSFATIQAVHPTWRIKPPSGCRWCNGWQLVKRK